MSSQTSSHFNESELKLLKEPGDQRLKLSKTINSRPQSNNTIHR